MLANMQADHTVPPLRDIVLIGGGHAHVQVLKSFGMRPEPGVRLTLVTPTLETPYSGMLPGCIAGVYSEDEIHIKLLPLSHFAGARLVVADATGIDPDAGVVQLQDRPPLRYDLLSINCGAVPVGADVGAVTVKPISTFLPKWRELREGIRPGQRLLVVGAGAGGVELAMAARTVLPAACSVTLLGETLMPGHGSAAAKLVQHHLVQAGIDWIAGRAERETSAGLLVQDGRELPADYVLWVTQVQAPVWLRSSGLRTDGGGFVMVDKHLRSLSHTNVFAAGDVAHLDGQQRAKSGVYAVRAGPYLAENLRRAVRSEPLRAFRAQTNHLALLATGTGSAIASRGRWAASGSPWWYLKDQIDRAFVNKFNRLPEIPEVVYELPAGLKEDLPEQSMRCGGCGAKLAADPLRRVLSRLPKQVSAQVILGIGDDAAQVCHSSPTTLLSVDGFRAMVDDPYLFGRIAAHHSLNDIFAMGATPVAGLAFITVPLMAAQLMEEELFQLLSGVTAVLNEHGVALVGGHSAEGAELSIGLTVTGRPADRVVHKSGCVPGDALILTKPIGTGVVLAAAMQRECSSKAMQATLAVMDASNAPALTALLEAQVSALTDVTGFGLGGHLAEMLRASGCGVRLDLAHVPLLPEAAALIAHKQSSLQTSNELALNDFELGQGLRPDEPALRLLADPQTSGGLLASVPAGNAAACLAQMRSYGIAAAQIGEIRAGATWSIVP